MSKHCPESGGKKKDLEGTILEGRKASNVSTRKPDGNYRDAISRQDRMAGWSWQFHLKLTCWGDGGLE